MKQQVGEAELVAKNEADMVLPGFWLLLQIASVVHSVIFMPIFVTYSLISIEIMMLCAVVLKLFIIGTPFFK